MLKTYSLVWSIKTEQNNNSLNMRKFITAITAMLVAFGVSAQETNFCGETKFDSIHTNEVVAYAQVGTNTVSGFYMGATGLYTHHFNNKWAVEGGANLQIKKNLVGLSARGIYHFTWTKHSDFFASGKLMFNRYNKFKACEYIGNLSMNWQTSYFDMTLGGSLIHWNSMGSGYTEPITLTFGIGANIRRRSNPWNIGLFFRNYDDFYYENWNINWGVRFYAPLPHKLKLFGELNVRPAGSMSQLATRYETHVKLGIKHVW